MSTLKVNTITAVDGSAPSIPGFEGGGGGSGAGADAWALTDQPGVLLNGLNIASVTRSAAGKYDYVFSTPMPSADYSLTGNVTDATGSSTNGYISFSNVATTGFTVTTKDGSNTTTNRPHSLAVFATNALPPKGGTGTDAWGSVQSDGTINASFNVASVTRTGTGQYDVEFTTPMPTSNYSALVSTNFNAASSTAMAYDLTSTGFSVRCNGSGGTVLDRAFSFTVNATNATLPQTVTQEQIDSAINNPGASAWGDIASDGTLNGGLNVASVTRTGAGVYEVVFTTPIPNANYAVNCSTGTNNRIRFQGKTTLGFTAVTIDVQSTNTPQDAPFGFTVFATNALPPKGGTGADAWGTSNGTTLNAGGFNIASMVRNSTGNYTYTFTTPMPTVNYAVAGSLNQNSFNGFLVCKNRSTDSFIVETCGQGGNAVDSPHTVTVHATNATLPTTFTEAQIQSVIDAQPQGIAKAWVNFNGTGTVAIRDSFNVSSITDNGDGDYTVNYTSIMPNTNYVPVFTNIVRSNQTAANSSPGLRSPGDNVSPFDSITVSGLRMIHRPSSVNQNSNMYGVVVFSS